MSRDPVPARQLLDDLEQHLARVTTDVDEVVVGLTPTQLRWRPEPKRWSIAHCLEHLIEVEEMYAGPLRAGIEGAGRESAPAGGGTYSPGWLADWFIRNAGPEGRRKLPAPPRLQPPPDVPGRVRERFATSQEKLLRLVVAARDVNLDESRVKHPFIPLVRLSVGEALDFLVAHERRHVGQARRVREAPGFPVSPLDG